MLFQTTFDFDWILGLGLSIFIAIILTALVSVREGSISGSGKVFFMFLPIGLAVSVYADLIDLWIFILSFIFSIIIIFFEVKGNNNG